jgi:hypothetical protein
LSKFPATESNDLDNGYAEVASSNQRKEILVDEVPLCPTVWPEHLIDIIRHHHGPLPDPWKVQVTDAILVAINLYHTAPFVTDQGSSKELQRIAVAQLKAATDQFEQQALKELE